MVQMLQGGNAGQAENQDTQTVQSSEEAAPGLLPSSADWQRENSHQASEERRPRARALLILSQSGVRE